MSYTTRETYTVLETGANDATGQCSGRYADNSHAITLDGNGEENDDGTYDQRTSESDLPQTMQGTQDTPLRGVIRNGKLYEAPVIASGVSFLTATDSRPELNGSFYVPASSLFDLTYSKTFDYSVGCDYHGDISSNQVGAAPDTGPFWYGRFTVPFGGIALIRKENVIGVAVQDQQMTLEDHNEEWSVPAGLTFGQFAQTGFQLRVSQTFAKFETQVGTTDFAIAGTNVYSNIATGQDLYTETFERDLPRCYRPALSVTAPNRFKSVVVNPGFAGDFNGQPLLSPVNTQWRYDIRFDDIDEPVTYSAGWINKLAVDIDLTDAATFRCLSFKAYRSDGSLFKEVYPDPDENSLEDALTIDIDARVGDSYVVAFDNMGNHTTEVTNVTFNLPMVSAVDRTTESFTAYEFNTFTFDGPVFGGIFPPGASTSTLTFTHDQSGNDIVSPFTLVLRSVNGIQE